MNSPLVFTFVAFLWVIWVLTRFLLFILNLIEFINFDNLRGNCPAFKFAIIHTKKISKRLYALAPRKKGWKKPDPLKWLCPLFFHDDNRYN